MFWRVIYILILKMNKFMKKKKINAQKMIPIRFFAINPLMPTIESSIKCKNENKNVVLIIGFNKRNKKEPGC